MKQSMRKFFLFAVLLLNTTAGWGQLRIFTRSYMIQDFKSKPTKVVLDGTPEINAALRQEITILWAITPYEFCSPADYKKQKNNSDCYFLHTETDKGIIYLTIARGGKKGDDDALKRPVTLVSLPIGGENDGSGRASLYMPAFVSILQDYAEEALNSEYVAYKGLKASKLRIPPGYRVFKKPAEADKAFLDHFENGVSNIVISPDGNPKAKHRYELSVGTSDYRLYRYVKR